jgi:cell division protein ZapD
MLPIRQGLTIVLRLLRSSGRAEMQLAQRGAYQLMLGGRNAQLIRLRIGKDEPVLPEISAGKLAINVRFLRPDMAQRPRQIEADVAFEMTLCNL